MDKPEYIAAGMLRGDKMTPAAAIRATLPPESAPAWRKARAYRVCNAIMSEARMRVLWSKADAYRAYLDDESADVRRRRDDDLGQRQRELAEAERAYGL